MRWSDDRGGADRVIRGAMRAAVGGSVRGGDREVGWGWDDAINQGQPPGGRRAGSREAVPLVACAFSSGLLPKPQPTSV